MNMQQDLPVNDDVKVLLNENSVGPFEGTPKTMFFMGLFAGIAVCTTAMLAFFVWSVTSGKGIQLAASTTGKVAGVTVQPTAADQPANPSADTQQPAKAAGPVKPVDANDHVKGPKDAKVTLIEYSDFECPYCKRHFEVINEIAKAYPNDVKLVFRHFPLSFHQNAEKEAEASECAADLGGNDAFWKMHDKIFTETTSNGTGIALERLPVMAQEIGLDQAKFKSCLDSGKYAAKVAKDQQEGADAGVEGTPATFVNGTLVSGAQPLSNFKTVIDGILKK